MPPGTPLRRVRDQEPVLDDALDWELIERGRRTSIEHGGQVALARPVLNVNRCVGGLLSSAIAKPPRRGRARGGLDQRPFRGSAGQSFGALARARRHLHARRRGQRLHRQGTFGRQLVVRPPPDAGYVAEDNVIIGNTVLYGATERPRVLPRPRGRAFRRAQLRRLARSSRASAITAAST